MGLYIFEYIWIDGYNNIRSKNRVVELKVYIDDLHYKDNYKKLLKYIDSWSFDGSSTGQATGKDSDVLLVPVNIFINPFIEEFTTCNGNINSYLILCECYDKNNILCETNTRNKCVETYKKCENKDPLFGIEQEYVIIDNKKDNPYLWNERLSNKIILDDTNCNKKFIDEKYADKFYCGIGGNVCFGREITEKHMIYSLKAGIKLCGTNSEVTPSQWEFQVGPLNPLDVSDQLIVARYILSRIAEEKGCSITYDPKPCGTNFNGSGGHVNYSTCETRDNNDGLEKLFNLCEKLGTRHKEHMKVYGKDNHLRLTGIHETSNINDFSWGVSDRGKSIRIPGNVYKNRYGYLEDRRPAANLDPYLVTNIIMETTILL